jgi:hypothetical protein
VSSSYRRRRDGTLHSNQIGIITLPEFPGDADWGLRLKLVPTGG